MTFSLDVVRVFSRNVVWGGGGGGGIAFVGRENVKKTDKICYCLGGGGNLNTWVGGGGGGIFPS